MKLFTATSTCICLPWLTALLLISPPGYAQTEQLPDLTSIPWIHGAEDCDAARTHPDYNEWQEIQYQVNTYIFRQNKCANYEAPFTYLFIGKEKSLLIDTGATVEGGASLIAAVRKITDKPLIVVHSHGHGDHIQGDIAFYDADKVKVAGTGADAVQEFFGFSSWPEEPTNLELGNRNLEILPIPGHTDDDLAYYDPVSRFLVTGDSLYPGRLYVRDWPGYRASIARLDQWIRTKSISHVMGTHIEMTAVPDVDYPMGSEYQPGERHLPLSVYDIATLSEALENLDEPGRTYLGSFIIWPVQ